MLRSWQTPLRRAYTTKAKRIVLLQDERKIKVYEPNVASKHTRRAYAWGFQETGALGLLTDVKKAQERYTEVVQHPTRMQFSVNSEITDLTAGYGFSAFAVERSDGETLFGCGLNTDSQLGFQTKGHHNDPKKLDVIIYPTAIALPRLDNETSEDLKVRCLAAGRAHLVVVARNGTIFTMGNNSYGQCGREVIEQEDYRRSALIHRISESDFCEAEDRVVAVECGQDHTLFLTQLGRVYSCGWGADGQTGLGHYQNCSQITRLMGDIAGERIVKLSCAADCVLALNERGEAFGWGNSEYGQLDASPEALTQINLPRALQITQGIGCLKDVAVGGAFCLALNTQGEVYSWGFGILGFGPNVQQSSKPQLLPPPLFGRNEFSSETTVESIGCGLFHLGAINSEGDLYMWGRNNCGQLGLGHKKDQFFPFKTAVNAKVQKVVFGVDHTLALCQAFM